MCVPSIRYHCQQIVAIRVEIVAIAYNFLAERLEPELNDVITKMKKMLSANSLSEFVESSLDICKHVFPGEDLLQKDCSQTEHVNSGIAYLVYHVCQWTPMLDAHCQFFYDKCCRI